MDFRWSEAQQALYEETQAFACDRLRMPEETGESVAFGPASERWSLMGERGLLGMCAPERYGGLGLDALSTACAMEALGTGCDDMGLIFSAAAHLFACVMPLAEYGSDALKLRLLPSLCSGAAIGANAITEAEAGSDAFSLRTTARRDGDAYVLCGVKSYVTNAPLADVAIVYARTDATAGHLGISAFALETGCPGASFSAPFRKMGLESTPSAELRLEDCRVPVAARLGEEGEGAAIFRSSMQWERACLFAGYLGQMNRQLEHTICRARTRKQFGKKLGSFQAVSHRIADMKLRLEAARLLLRKACWSFDQGDQDATLDISLAKLAVSEAAVQSSLDALQIHGGGGYDAGSEPERALRDALAARLFSGTSEIQRELVARELGL
jgi:alkylation response protein AidB-like acyl-CoA dehydrogenase